MHRPNHEPGFTIVELLIVIVVIGILAAITIVAYNGVQQRAVAATLASDLDNASKQLKLFQIDHGAYPVLINDCPAPADVNMCLKSSTGNTFGVYQYNNGTNPQTFRLNANNNTSSYHITNSSIPISGISSGVITNGLVAYYPLDGNANDASSNGNHGEVHGATISNGAIGQGYSFNGVDTYLLIPGVPYIATTNATLTFSFWVQGGNYGAAQSILSRRQGCNNDGLFNIYVSGNRVHLAYYTTGAADQYSDAVLENGKPYFITWVKPFGQLGAKLYINGIETPINNDSALQGLSDPTLPMVIGAQWSYDVCYGVPALPSQMRSFFTGSIDDVRIYNRALSVDEINTLYNL